MRNASFLTAFLLLSIFSCTPDKKQQDKTDIFYQMLEAHFEEDMMSFPEYLSRMGRNDRAGELDDISEGFERRRVKIARKRLGKLTKWKAGNLDEQGQISLQLYKKKLEDILQNEEFRHNSYPINQMGGPHSGFPSFMINVHKIDSTIDAASYISRIRAVGPKFDQLIENLEIRAAKNVIVPKFALNHVLSDITNILNSGKPIEENIIYRDFSSKIAKTDIPDSLKSNFDAEIRSAINETMIPAYQELHAFLVKLEAKAGKVDGVWRFPDGKEFYEARLKKITTTNLTAEEIFELGQQEVKRIHSEIQAIMKKVNFEGDLQDFFKFSRTNPDFYYPDSEEGKKQMIEGYTKIVDDMEAKLDEMFFTKPKAKMIVKAVEEFREKSAGKAFYQNASPDGKRPGIFYANLFKMADMPTYEMEALAFHEGIPGHHMQLSISQELESIPKFRKYGRYTAYVEGWGLYCEYFPREFGFYQDPYSDFGRLAMELWRACRLVVDPGIHSKKWTREEAIQFLMDNTPNSENSCTKAIERYIVMPGQATAYKIGMIKIMELRERAMNELGDKWDIRAFHDFILLSGPLPLDLLEERFAVWLKNP